MKDTPQPPTPLDLEITGETIEAHGYTITPTARVRGKVNAMENDEGKGNWGWVAIRPLKITAGDREGQTREVSLANAEVKALAGMAVSGFVVALVCVLISVLARRRS